MKQNYKTSFEDIILNLWKSRYFVLITCIIFIVLGHIYHTSKTKIYYTEATLKSPSNRLYSDFENLLGTDKINELSLLFYNDLRLKLILKKNFIDYLKASKKYNELVSSKELAITRGKNSYRVGSKAIGDSFRLYFTETVPGPEILDNFILYTKENTEIYIKSVIKSDLENAISFVEKELEIAELINLEKSLFETNSNNLDNILTYNNFTYQHGSKVLNRRLEQLKKTTNQLKNLRINYDPFIVSSSSKEISSSSYSVIQSIFFLFGLVLSTTIVFIRPLVVHKKKK